MKSNTIITESTLESNFKEGWQKDEIYAVMNTENCAHFYPTIYDVCYCLYYKGKVPQRLLKSFKILQSEDVRKYNYVPAYILNKVNSFLQS